MDIDARIQRRQRRDDESRLVDDYDALSPAAHIGEPADRGHLLERLLDHLDPVFDGELPPHGYLYGPKGVGKSAVVTALFTQFDRLTSDRRDGIHTATRVRPTRNPRFVYLDTRHRTSEFAFYHALLNAVADRQVPRHGLSTDRLRERLHDHLADADAGVVLSVDHVGEPGSTTAETLVERVARLPAGVSLLAVGRTDPGETVLTDHTAASIRVSPYRLHVLVDVLLARASRGLGRSESATGAITDIAQWADGDAHDALAALFVAADRATRAGRATIAPADLRAAFDAVPDDCVALGRVFALPANKQTVLRALLDLDPAARASVTAATAAIAGAETCDLAAGTIKRYLYELAAVGIVALRQSADGPDRGRPPSRLEPKFPPTVFRRLYELEV